jgi:hypothetical protein
VEWVWRAKGWFWVAGFSVRRGNDLPFPLALVLMVGGRTGNGWISGLVWAVEHLHGRSTVSFFLGFKFPLSSSFSYVLTRCIRPNVLQKQE